MAEEPKAAPGGGDNDEVDDPDADVEDAERAERLTPELLAACMKNDTEAVIRLLDEAADPCAEDMRQWSPLVWAASHGNEQLTRLLISKGAAEVYKYNDAAGKVRRKKHSPLHWAAFKGHLKVLWVLMAPPQNLSHHERDAIGNTALHQAAAGGSLECVECLLAQGVDVFAKNDRGHTPYVLCTVPDVQNLLMRAMNSTACKATGKQFSSTILRYLCSWSHDVFCESAVTTALVYESPDAKEKEKPVTWCKEVKQRIEEAEHQLHHAMHLSQLDTITAALEAAEDKPVDCKLVHQCRQVKAKLESEIQLGEAMQVQVITDLDEFAAVHEALTKAIEDAEWKHADAARVAAAKALRRKLMSEASLTRAVERPQKTTPGHITMLEELALAAKAENADEELQIKATKLIAKLKSEREVQRRIALCDLLYVEDTNTNGNMSPALIAINKRQEGLPDWCFDTEKFEEFHEEYKQVVEVGEGAEISSELQNRALSQLMYLEGLLVEKKQMEAEQQLKAAKKKKGKK